MDPSVDNSPLWGASQLSFLEFNRHQAPPPQQPSPWGGDDPHQQQHQQVLQQPGYNLYPGEVDANYAGAQTNKPPVAEVDSTDVENRSNIYQHVVSGYHPPTAPPAEEPLPVPHENGPYPPAEANGSRQNLSPDGGYSSAESEYYATYQILPQGYTGDSSYQNVNSPPETGAVKYEALEVKQEAPEVYRCEQFSVQYIPPSDLNGVQKPEESKPIIHENILIKPAINPQNQLITYEEPQFQVIELQNPLNYQTQEHLPYAQTVQVHQQFQQSGQNQVVYQQQKEAQSKQRKPRKSRQFLIGIDGQRPSTLKVFPTPRFRLLQANRPNSANNKPEEISEENSARRSARPSVIENSDFKCQKCGTFFARQCGLTQHQKWIHAERKFPCERCGKKFPSKEDLIKHVKRHDMADKPFKCPVCPKQFCHKNDLRRHMYRHEDSTPYMCDMCPKCFIRKDHLLAHRQSHDRREKRTQEREN